MNRTTQALLTLTATLAVGSANAALTTASFTDASFENGGSTDTSANSFYTANNTNDTPLAMSALTEGTWVIRAIGTNPRNGILEKSNDYENGSTTVPAGVDGNQFFTASRASNQLRSALQYVDLGAGGVSGDVTISIDSWVHELNDETASGTNSADIAFEIFAFNNLSDVTAIVSSTSNITDTIATTGTAVSAGGTFNTVASTDAATGFTTLSETLNLGATTYQYVGVFVGTYGGDGNGSSGAVASWDNLQVVPEPGSLALMGLGGLCILRRRRG